MMVWAVAMRAILIFSGVYIVSIAVTYAAGNQVAEYFYLDDEFTVVMIALALFSLVAIAAFAALYVVQPNVTWLGYGAIGLAVAAFGIEQVPALADAFARRSTNPYLEDRALAVSFLLPALVMLLIQWLLLRRRWLVAHRLEHRTLWPWFTLVLAGSLAFSPLGLALIGSVIRQSSTDWLVGLETTIVAVACGVLLVLALIEYWLRRRSLARRAAAP